MTIILRSVHQPDWEIPLEAGEYSVGRSEDNQIVLPDASVSRHHVTLWIEGNILTASDQGSANGTFVNGARIQQAQLMPGDILKIGGYMFTCVGPSEAVTMPEAMTPTLIEQPGPVTPPPGYVLPDYSTPPPPPPAPPQPTKKKRRTLPLVLGIGVLVLIAAAGAVIIALLLMGRNKSDLTEQEEALFIANSIVESDYPDYMVEDPSISEWQVQGGDGYMVSYSLDADESAGMIFPRALNIYVNPETNEVMIEEMN
ncbi:MAG: FHA domain-containing protein [Anaerolineae bacterium]|nr:FHA domain-containing protein [Anaerolineae bacterium]